MDSWGGRLNLLWIASLPLGVYLLMGLLPRIDPRRESYLRHERAYEALRVLIVAFFMAVGWITVAASLGVSLDVGALLVSLAGVLFIGIGNYLGQLRPNYFVGIRTPWTLADEEVWRRTHRRGGWVFVLMGLGLLLSLLAPGRLLAAAVAFGGTLAGVGYLLLYSYLEFRKRRPEGLGGGAPPG